ncbi:pyridoxal phosphate-dependent aminotransferase [Paraburkholderia acidisoli]|uniref:Aminotransferase n=1 Tax=Paraburkholderia acidisoli TaxID=2571748 RepID=A0A7Z2GQ75_9BURK|nr:pyridoxal phosphate-dependent aminotransferase [Paraburkholderia acidisoli]QGZ65972.1 aminotransferase class I/II-fold pyridoxal phosphate-dependent enzyme [Paraburkholderia acidisoli]
MSLTRDAILNMPDSPIIDVWRLGVGRSDVIGLWAGESDLPTPKQFSEAAMAALANGQTFYSQNRGVPALRQAIAAYYQRLCNVTLEDERIAATCSGMNSVMLVAQAIIEPGDNVVCVTPSWPNILRAITITGGEVRSVPLGHGEDGWHLDLQRLFDACDARTKAIYYASPGNPTGWMIEPEQQRELMAFARERGIAILADEVYQRIVYDRSHAPSLLELATPDDPVFVINSFSKAWAMTGWRMGWLVYPRAMLETFEKLIQFNTSGGQAFLQAGATVALNEGEPFVKSFVERCRGGQKIALERLRAIPGVSVVPNQASFYLMFSVEGVSDTLDFCKRAVRDAGVGLAPGIAFGEESAQQIRLCYARSDASLIEAMDRLENFIGR